MRLRSQKTVQEEYGLSVNHTMNSKQGGSHTTFSRGGG
jgi:hypothetical protein